jgi:hypothetical protein
MLAPMHGIALRLTMMAFVFAGGAATAAAASINNCRARRQQHLLPQVEAAIGAR